MVIGGGHVIMVFAWYRRCNQSPPGRRGGQRAVGRTDPSAKARGARTDGASGGWVGTWLGIAFVNGIANVIMGVEW